MKLHDFYLLTAVIGASFGSVAFAVVESPATAQAASSEADPAVADADSIVPPSPAEILTDSASEAYKKVKFMEYEGEIESVLYAAALEANKLAMEAIAIADTPDLEQRNRNALIDLNPLLLNGAVYHSSAGHTDEVPLFARAYIDAQQLPQMAAVEFKHDMRIYPTLLYNAAYGATKNNETEKAKDYFRLYLKSGDESLREGVLVYYGQACLTTGDYLNGVEALSEGVSFYPRNERILALALQCCIDGGYPQRLQPLLDRALLLNPDDEKLLNLQARLYSTNRDYRQALDIYLKIAQAHPNSLENTRRLANCYYNLGASFYNQSIMEEDEKASKRASRQSKAYFTSAATTIEQLLATTPSDTKYLRALVQAYAALGERENFERTNTRLQALGEKGVAFNAMPVIMDSDSFSTNRADAGQAVAIPTYQEFARPFIEKRLGTWAMRGEFEQMEDYRKRIAEGGGAAEYAQLNKLAETEYLNTYARQLVIDDLNCSSYDIDNETYRVDTPYGAAILKVPYKNKEAELFKAGWESAQIRTPRFIIRDDKVALASITFVVNGKKYTYNSSDAATYVTPNVYVDLNGILAAASAREDKASGNSPTANTTTTVFADSDVDIDIPVTGRKAEKLFALIIANEHYDRASNVFGALHDGSTMHKYCTKTLGIPEHQAVLLNNATGNQIHDAIEQLKRRVKGTGADAEVIFYYAGHGLPDDATKEAYLLPVDGNPITTATLIPMQNIYRDLGGMGAASVSVFIDACFSGSTRDNSMIKKDARAVVMKPKEVAPEGNMFVLTAASGQETALPYKEKHHGLFTYFLLKKLQESKGNATLRQISDYVKTNVYNTSNQVNAKEQNPSVSVSGELSKTWNSKRLKP